ncbi:endolysin [Gordonia phage Pleakley]|uniref:Lysin A, protease C39 domain n=1 Tax=Gordonia phage Pleakley TaxID=2283246 RepID=A0A345M6H3_9CAUD|nr:endolysin [Gordonia phage Pleakley]AXH49781.1 lysin A, protease C39 domain [Gordonia phage Fury]AXH66094.1 lysin A, protease C39 domain [Gordonia phage Pleakley]
MAAGDVLLKFNNSIIPQETYYWCGPATMQVLLSARGIDVSEADMARALGTTVNGTDYIGYLTRELNKRVGDVYRTVDFAQETPSIIEQFRKDLKKSVDAGFGIGANIMVPPTNYPRTTRGERAAYSGGWVYHYFSVMGYNLGSDEAAVADSGFRDYFYWIKIPQLVSMIAGKGYTAARNAKSPEFLGALSTDRQRRIADEFAQLGEF